jgi:hypothetical protein
MSHIISFLHARSCRVLHVFQSELCYESWNRTRKMRERKNKKNERSVTNVKISFSICLFLNHPSLCFKRAPYSLPQSCRSV